MDSRLYLFYNKSPYMQGNGDKLHLLFTSMGITDELLRLVSRKETHGQQLLALLKLLAISNQSSPPSCASVTDTHKCVCAMLQHLNVSPVMQKKFLQLHGVSNCHTTQSLAFEYIVFFARLVAVDRSDTHGMSSDNNIVRAPENRAQFQMYLHFESIGPDQMKCDFDVGTSMHGTYMFQKSVLWQFVVDYANLILKSLY